MARNKTLIPLVAALVIVVVCTAAGAWVAQSRDAWFVRTMLDRAAPWQQPGICYAPTPDAESYFQIYDDARAPTRTTSTKLRPKTPKGQLDAWCWCLSVQCSTRTSPTSR